LNFASSSGLGFELNILQLDFLVPTSVLLLCCTLSCKMLEENRLKLQKIPLEILGKLAFKQYEQQN
jgi:hypothetical protein